MEIDETEVSERVLDRQNAGGRATLLFIVSFCSSVFCPCGYAVGSSVDLRHIFPVEVAVCGLCCSESDDDVNERGSQQEQELVFFLLTGDFSAASSQLWMRDGCRNHQNDCVEGKDRKKWRKAVVKRTAISTGEMKWLSCILQL